MFQQIMSELNSGGVREQAGASARLIAIVEVPKSEQVKCAQPGCNHSVYKAVHIVRDGGQLLVLGSTCFQKRFGSLSALGKAQYGGGGGKLLTSEERMLLAENTEALLARFEAQEARLRQEEALRLQHLRETARRALAPMHAPAVSVTSHAPVARSLPTRPRFPWPWMMPASSVAAFKLRDGTGWVRVEHQDRRQFIVPWPSFEGWEEALPPVVGRANVDVGGYEVLGDVRDSLAYLRTQMVDVWRDERRTGLWSDVVDLLGGGR